MIVVKALLLVSLVLSASALHSSLRAEVLLTLQTTQSDSDETADYSDYIVDLNDPRQVRYSLSDAP